MSDGFLRPPSAGGTGGPGTPDGPTLAPPGISAPPSTPGPSTPGPASAAGQAQPAASPSASSPTTSGPRPWLWVHTARPNPLEAPSATPVSTASTPATTGAPAVSPPAAGHRSTSAGTPPGPAGASRTPASFPPARVCHDAPRGLEMTGGTTTQLDGAITLDRLASGYGALTISWSHTGEGRDLLALVDGSTVDPRGDEFVIDLLPGLDRILICTGTARGVELPASSIIVANGSTRVECRLPAGTSYGVWPRLSLVGVDEFVVLLDEHDPSSGDLGPVAAAYGHDAATFVRAGR